MVDSNKTRILSGFKNFKNDSSGDCNLVTRSEWGAREPNHQIPSLNAIPPHYVVIHHSATRSCNDTESCKQLLKSIQNYHMDDREWCDIGYNFLVSSNKNENEI